MSPKLRSVGGPAGISDGPAGYHLDIETDAVVLAESPWFAGHARVVDDR
jgi:hypothetical protein